MAPSDIEPTTLRLVAQCLNQLRYRVTPEEKSGGRKKRKAWQRNIKRVVIKQRGQVRSSHCPCITKLHSFSLIFAVVRGSTPTPPIPEDANQTALHCVDVSSQWP